MFKAHIWLTALNLNNIQCSGSGCNGLLYFASSMDTPVVSVTHISHMMKADAGAKCSVCFFF